MTLTSNTRLRSVSINGQPTEVADVDIVSEGGEAIPYVESSGVAGHESGDWTYSATAESVGGSRGRKMIVDLGTFELQIRLLNKSFLRG